MFETLFVLLIIAAAGIFFYGRTQFRTPKTAPSDHRTYRHFEAAPSIFVNRAEMTFFHTLDRVIPDGFSLLSKVRLEDVVKVKNNVRNPEHHWKLRARVKSRHVDFLIIDNAGKPVLAIELDGSAHRDPDSFNADSLKNGLFKAAGIPLERVPADVDFTKISAEIIDRMNALTR